MHHVALDGAGPHDRHLDDEIVEASRLQARQHVHLRAALDLEDADGLGPAQHVVDGGILARQRRERPTLVLVCRDQVEGAADTGEHPEAKHIDFQQPDRGEIVLVPFDERAVLHGRIADWNSFHERAARQHEAADMLGEMTRKTDELVRQLDHAL